MRHADGTFLGFLVTIDIHEAEYFLPMTLTVRRSDLFVYDGDYALIPIDSN